MKILVISDTHGVCEMLELVLEKTGKVDLLIHCGDIEGQEYRIEKTAGCFCYMVSGNNDWGPGLPKEILTEIRGFRFFICHGHRYGVSRGLDMLKSAAASRNADVCLFGHTHRPMIETEGGLTMMNPGSLTYPRQPGRRPSYGIVEIDGDGKIRFRIENL